MYSYHNPATMFFCLHYVGRRHDEEVKYIEEVGDGVEREMCIRINVPLDNLQIFNSKPGKRRRPKIPL